MYNVAYNYHFFIPLERKIIVIVRSASRWILANTLYCNMRNALKIKGRDETKRKKKWYWKIEKKKKMKKHTTVYRRLYSKALKNILFRKNFIERKNDNEKRREASKRIDETKVGFLVSVLLNVMESSVFVSYRWAAFGNIFCILLFFNLYCFSVHMFLMCGHCLCGAIFRN